MSTKHSYLHMGCAIAGALILSACGTVQSAADAGGDSDATPGVDGGVASPDGAPGVDANNLPQFYTLNIAVAGSSTGVVRDDDGTIGCSADCSQSVFANSTLTLTAELGDGAVFAGWSVPHCGQDPQCTITVTGDMDITATFMEQPNYMFVTSRAFSGSLDGLAGADAKCQSLAEAGGLSGTYVAWLSSSTVNAADRLGNASGWVRPDGKPFANTVADLVAGRLLYPARITDRGSALTNVSAWTATKWDGSLDDSGNCGDWTSTEGTAAVGSTGMGGSRWTRHGTSSCGTARQLYCFGVDRQGWTEQLPMTGRVAFVTSQGFDASTGLAGADALCASDAAAVGLSGSFKALLAADGATAASRFDVEGAPWQRVDGVVLAENAGATFELEFWDAPLHVTADGAGYLTNYGIWGGASGFYVAGATATTCNNWSSTAATGTAGSSGHTETSRILANSEAAPCASSYRLMCLQE